MRRVTFMPGCGAPLFRQKDQVGRLRIIWTMECHTRKFGNRGVRPFVTQAALQRRFSRGTQGLRCGVGRLAAGCDIVGLAAATGQGGNSRARPRLVRPMAGVRRTGSSLPSPPPAPELSLHLRASLGVGVEKLVSASRATTSRP